MSDYEPTSAPPPEPRRTRPTGEAPSSIQRAVLLVWAVVAFSLLSTILNFVFIDDLVQSAMEAPGAGGELDEGTARTTVVAGGVVNLLFVALWLMLGVLLRRGANWARIALTVLAGIGVLVGLVGLTGGGPGGAFLVVGAITLVLQAALLYFLWQKDSSAYLRHRPTYRG